MNPLLKRVQLLSKIPVFHLSRVSGRGILYPVNITISLLYACNSRCKTCNVYLKKVKTFTVEEYDRLFQKLGKAPYWFTFSGGEPFLRKDIASIVRLAYQHTRPGIINIPTNGSFYDRIPELVEEIVVNCPESEIIINLSLDHLGERHNEIRGLEDNWNKAMKTYQALRELKRYPNFTIGIHTVISNFNVKEFREIYQGLIELEPDSYITEIAEQRVELGTMDEPITPQVNDYAEAIDFLRSEMRKRKYKGVAQIAQAFRYEYYQLVKHILQQQTQVIPCFAGVMSAQISPDGHVWPCCIRADSMGNLREHDYDFKKIWRSAQAAKIRESIRNKECHCPLANASYTNMLASPSTMWKVVKHLRSW
ncbi:MAG: radical SAM protein [Calditrichaeota bacterium]|nr:MAG: radical SAM protein [Calditrichota bacterium]